MLRPFSLLTTTILVSSFASATSSPIPEPPQLSAKGYVLMDYHTGTVLVEKNANEALNPASLTKLMTSYVAGKEMANSNIAMDDKVRISQNAWARNFPDSSKMFIEVGKDVVLEDLYRGMIIQSGNDASVAIAEHIAGSEASFVGMMNAWADRLGMNNSSFANPHGLDAKGLYSTPYDMALLSQAIIRDLPDIYPMYSELSFTYNNITQGNRNRLLRNRSLNVDGMKTGYTQGAGYSLVSSATEGDMRLIAVVMGTSSPQIRESESVHLIRYGFRFYETLNPHAEGEKVVTKKVYMGESDELKLGVSDDVFITLSRSDTRHLNAEAVVDNKIQAPVSKGDKIGSLVYRVGDNEVHRVPLIALEEVDQGGVFRRLIDWVKLFVLSFR
ncbi:D-alanyl-D-alanine carboxypeptidase family protein [Vibrio sp. HN007]|uniref:D-alanyl-D-alanine carboxypeptidase family protein n=1 Tax=Vibrio iocasae TaxID=3098914 RepID=UPI0035D3FCDB